MTDGEAAAAIALRGGFSSKAVAQRALQNKLAGSYISPWVMWRRPPGVDLWNARGGP